MYQIYHKHYIWYFYINFIGVPIPIVVVSTAISNEYYGINDRYLNCMLTKLYNLTCTHRCWISEENGTIWAFIGPMLLIILVIIYLQRSMH